jgi:hypothetical protein
LHITPPGQSPEEQQEELDSLMKAEDMKRKAQGAEMKKLQAEMLATEYAKLEEIVAAAFK